MIMKGVIPAAGSGSRLYPITTRLPKELLPIFDKPLIDFSIEEAISSGIDAISIVIRKDKVEIRKHIEDSPNFRGTYFNYIYQPEPRGLGDAILTSGSFIGESKFCVLLPDDIIVDTEPCMKQLISLYKKYGTSIIAIEKVDNVEKYGVINGIEIAEGIYRVEDLIEKPKKFNAQSNIGIIGRYILTPEIFPCLRKIEENNTGEIEITDAIRILLQKEDIYAYQIKGKRYDCGDLKGYLKASIDLIHPSHPPPPTGSR